MTLTGDNESLYLGCEGGDVATNRNAKDKSPVSGNSSDRPRPRHPLNQRMTREQGREEGTNRGNGSSHI
jgi:hypothetical protein